MTTATISDIFGDQLILHYGADGNLWTDEAGTTAASDTDEVKAISAESDAQTSALITGSNGPIYHANYASSGYKALVFDGTNDALMLDASGLIVGADRMFVIACYTWISGVTLWCRGNAASKWVRGYCTTSAASMQEGSVNRIISTTGLPVEKRVTSWAAGTTHSQVDSLGFCAGNRLSLLPSLASATFTLGAYNIGTLAQFGSFALHEILVVSSDCRWGDIVLGSSIIRDKWGVAEPNALPLSSSSGMLRRSNTRAGY